MSHQEFIEKCNEFGEAKKSKSITFDDTARVCGPIQGFTKPGLSFLASLLSDQYTASGQLNEKGEAPDKSKKWSRSFLAEFNPEGYVCGDNPAMLRDFARQLSEAKEHFEPNLLTEDVQKKKNAQMPSKQVIEELIEKLRQSGEEIAPDLILEEVEDHYDENDMTLPANWEKVTEQNLRKWYGSALFKR